MSSLPFSLNLAQIARWTWLRATESTNIAKFADDVAAPSRKTRRRLEAENLHGLDDEFLLDDIKRTLGHLQKNPVAHSTAKSTHHHGHRTSESAPRWRQIVRRCAAASPDCAVFRLSVFRTYRRNSPLNIVSLAWQRAPQDLHVELPATWSGFSGQREAR